MNFPEIPFDESMFAERQFWDNELREISKKSLEEKNDQLIESNDIEQEHFDEIQDNDIVDAIVDDAPKDALVYEKSVTVGTTWTVIIIVAAVLIAIVMIRNNLRYRK
jgi:hypothetical protein